MICDCGAGKTAMSLGTAWSILKHRSFRLLVMCPGHIARKWKREMEYMIPGVVCKIIRNFTDLLRFVESTTTTTAPMVAVIGKDTAKLGYDVDRPCADKRKMKLRVRLESPSEMLDTVKPDAREGCIGQIMDAGLFVRHQRRQRIRAGWRLIHHISITYGREES